MKYRIAIVTGIKNDVELIEYFIENICEANNFKKFKIIDNNYLLNYDWPGNVRELRNLIERIAILSPGDDNERLMNIIKESLSRSIEDEFSVTETLTVPLKEARESFEKQYLVKIENIAKQTVQIKLQIKRMMFNINPIHVCSNQI